MALCYNDEMSTKTARTAAGFRHILAWILHAYALTLFKRTLEIGVRVCQTFAHGSHGGRQIPRRATSCTYQVAMSLFSLVSMVGL